MIFATWNLPGLANRKMELAEELSKYKIYVIVLCSGAKYGLIYGSETWDMTREDKDGIGAVKIYFYVGIVEFLDWKGKGMWK